ncbi:ATP-grasp domain-containing protein [Xenorhabdus bovienii]|uniref:dapdiamide A synthase n=1 Tax=Xenorhabdus bovienii TaxID=40576 RepID=UPI00237D31ED|nr:dapdiamide A synthase [Xenorhabdus bovienii]MDE1485748.1 ATP-grasp domain-containing protein [Xenorhabdus bovienii]MDE1495088.1 ATP-grasp domain-containing protein [Xenorhabdus bovienii]MDE9473139.1 ATP-grasp domain-containing protein [Xenorhabdus bovienii]MDE9476553.1 ATP-grasp domain-containing protein [Xenorhabdus bovienii]MDE9529335.1 ATP-grasp domain-containing protein [Xenorhabdus bovienii]
MPILNNKEVIVIIDAWSGSKYLFPAFQALGYFCLHIQSAFLPAVFIRDNQLASIRSDRHIVYDGDIEALLRELQPYAIKAILAGIDGAVPLVDQLNAALELPFSNSIELSTARRNKFLMQEQLACHHVASVKQSLITHHNELLFWLKNHDCWPVVLKPVQSAGTDGVFICHDIQQAEQAFAAIKSKNDLFGNQNHEVLCQEFLEGEEFVVNGIACQGQYLFTDLWQSKKKQHKNFPVYETQYLYYQNDENFDTLTGYTIQVCQALGIENGAFHAEVMMTPRGPVLIEIGARVAGGADPYIIEKCLGHSQISKLVQAVLYPVRFLQEIHQPRDFLDHKRAAYVYMISPTKGKVQTSPEEQFIKIEGVISVNYRHSPGDIQQETNDLLSSPGVVIAISNDSVSLNQVIAEIRSTESDFYHSGLTVIE